MIYKMRIALIFIIVLLNSCASHNYSNCGVAFAGLWTPTTVPIEVETSLINLAQDKYSYFEKSGIRFWYVGEAKNLLLCIPDPEIRRGRFYRGTLSSCFTQQYRFEPTLKNNYKLIDHTDIICTG